MKSIAKSFENALWKGRWHRKAAGWLNEEEIIQLRGSDSWNLFSAGGEMKKCQLWRLIKGRRNEEKAHLLCERKLWKALKKLKRKYISFYLMKIIRERRPQIQEERKKWRSWRSCKPVCITSQITWGLWKRVAGNEKLVRNPSCGPIQLWSSVIMK